MIRATKAIFELLYAFAVSEHENGTYLYRIVLPLVVIMIGSFRLEVWKSTFIESGPVTERPDSFNKGSLRVVRLLRTLHCSPELRNELLQFFLVGSGGQFADGSSGAPV